MDADCWDKIRVRVFINTEICLPRFFQMMIVNYLEQNNQSDSGQSCFFFLKCLKNKIYRDIAKELVLGFFVCLL